MYVLVRDNVPKIIKDANQVCNYASVVNPEMYVFLLKQKLTGEVNAFLSSKELVDIDKLVEVKTLIDEFVKESIGADEFSIAYNKKLTDQGGFEKRYIVFLPDQLPPQEQQEQQEQQEE